MFILEQLRQHAQTGQTALVGREGTLTYAQLDRRSDAFAAWLVKTLGGGKSPVAIYGQKQADFLPCIYGALKAGRPYLPIDSAIPLDRAKEILRDGGAAMVADLTGTIQWDGTVLNAEDLSRVLALPAEPDPSRWVKGEETAYLLFTSGSTGKPKGVPITAANLASFYRGLLPYLKGGPGDVMLHQVSYSFDVSGCAVYGGIARGMTLFTVDQELAGDYQELMAALGDSRLSVWVSTPSFAELCVQSGLFSDRLLPRLRQFLFCGEVLTHKLCDQLAQRFPKAELLNTYGPTEATILVTAARVTQKLRETEEPIPIGRPLEGVRLRLVDEEDRPVTGEDVCGELLILGGSVGPGYLNRPELTEARFFTDRETGLRGYRTGDLCWRRGDVYYYAGRADNQVKLNGFRIEPEDVENNLARLPGVSRAVVLPRWREGKVQCLAAFLLMEGGDGLTPLARSIALKKQAAEYLPGYMIPRQFFFVDSFPLTASGKVDRKALAARLEESAK